MMLELFWNQDTRTKGMMQDYLDNSKYHEQETTLRRVFWRVKHLRAVKITMTPAARAI